MCFLFFFFYHITSLDTVSWTFLYSQPPPQYCENYMVRYIFWQYCSLMFGYYYVARIHSIYSQIYLLRVNLDLFCSIQSYYFVWQMAADGFTGSLVPLTRYGTSRQLFHLTVNIAGIDRWLKITNLVKWDHFPQQNWQSPSRSHS